tara:strand:+ start:657 stop:1511 length:855 start_codon:yes stop_codon:yes gene_type:complete
LSATYTREGPSWALPYAAYLELFQPQQGLDDFASTPIDIEVSFGEQDVITKDGFGFRVGFKRVTVSVQPFGSEISRNGRLSRSIPKDELTRLFKKVVESSKSGSVELSGGISGTFSKLFSFFGVDAKAAADLNRTGKSNQTETFEAKSDIRILKWLSAGRWEIGDAKFGDPRRDDLLLRGAYVNPEGVDDNKPLCFVNADKSQTYEIIIEVSAHFDDMVYRQLGEATVGPAWETENKRLIEKVLVAKTLREQNRSDGIEPAEGEVVLCRGLLRVEPDQEAREGF